LNSVGGKRLVLKALQPPPYYLLISVELRCFDRYKIVYSPKIARDSIRLCHRVEIGPIKKRFRRILSCAENGEQVTGKMELSLLRSCGK
jgi:hypothetical protein